jgi:sugar/nucleoside kinase (ribokinase family)
MKTLPHIICIGALHWDLIGRTEGAVPQGADLPGRVIRRPGGVAGNLALALARAGLAPGLLAAVGADEDGAALLARCAAAGVAVEHVQRVPAATGRYLAIEGADGLIAAVADTAAQDAAGPMILQPLPQDWSGMAVIDGNLSASTLAAAAQRLAAAQRIFVPASPAKAARLRPVLAGATLYANRAEAEGLTGCAQPDAKAAATALIDAGARRAIVTDGAAPACDAGRDRPALTLRPGAAERPRVTGAGDAFTAAHIAATSRGAAPEVALRAALDAALSHITDRRET